MGEFTTLPLELSLVDDSNKDEGDADGGGGGGGERIGGGFVFADDFTGDDNKLRPRFEPGT